MIERTAPVDMMVAIHIGDCRDVLRTLPDESVHCVVTSPPYWGLRDYGTAKWDGGDPACDHSESKPSRKANAIATSGLDGGKSTVHMSLQFKGDCGHCGATRIDRQLGLEPDFRDYVAAMVAVFREVKRVLRKDGTVFLNLGDSYAGFWGNQGRKDERGTQRPINGRMLTPVHDGRYPDKQSNTGKITEGSGLKPKDLCGIPWRVAFALQEDGWWLRQDIIWSKPNPMPESVTDRCTKSHEYIFLLSKSERYYYDADAIAEPTVYPGDNRAERTDTRKLVDPMCFDAGSRIRTGNPTGITRNRRSVWEVTTQPFSEAHFATFPPALIEPCIKAGTSEKGCCAKCGTPWVREVERTANGGQRGALRKSGNYFNTPDGDIRGRATGADNSSRITSEAWSPSCKCDAPTVPCTVLDPFGGAGTTGLVADRLQRSAILIELNPDYSAMSERRIIGDAPLFADVRVQT